MHFTFVPSPPPSKFGKDVDPILETICLEHPLSFKAATFSDKAINFLKSLLLPLLAFLLLAILALIAVMIKFPAK